MKKYNHMVFAGTFDHLHYGHKKMLDRALRLAEKVSIGITSKKMYQSKVLAAQIEPYETREKEVKKYVSNHKNRVNFFKLSDPLGTSITDKTMDSILVTEETKKGAVVINRIRVKRGLMPLTIEKVPFYRAEDGDTITSERIRKGEIDAYGNRYINIFKNDLLLPEKLRKKLRTPLGKVIRGYEFKLEKAAKKTVQLIHKIKPSMVITVGDVVSSTLVNEHFIPDVQIIDLKTRREIIKNSANHKKVVNKPGTINKKAVSSIYKAIQTHFIDNKKKVIVIDGEEDLLALPALLLAPLGSIILYGQFDLGIVVVSVTENHKTAFHKIINQFVTN